MLSKVRALEEKQQENKYKNKQTFSGFSFSEIFLCCFFRLFLVAFELFVFVRFDKNFQHERSVLCKHERKLTVIYGWLVQ